MELIAYICWILLVISIYKLHPGEISNPGYFHSSFVFSEYGLNIGDHFGCFFRPAYIDQVHFSTIHSIEGKFSRNKVIENHFLLVRKIVLKEKNTDHNRYI